MTEKTTLIQNIKRLRKKHNLSQARFAEAIGMSNSYIAQLESGVGKPSFSFLEDAASFFGISISDLFKGDEAENKGPSPERVLQMMSTKWHLLCLLSQIPSNSDFFEHLELMAEGELEHLASKPSAKKTSNN